MPVSDCNHPEGLVHTHMLENSYSRNMVVVHLFQRNSVDYSISFYHYHYIILLK